MCESDTLKLARVADRKEIVSKKKNGNSTFL